jgi:hypothetical protein
VSIRRAWALAVMAALSGGGCAVLAGYDFGKYGETGGSGGSSGTGGLGGQAASGPSSSSGAASGGSSTTGQGGGASSGSGATASASSGSGATASVSSASTTASSSSSGSVGVTPIVSGLLDPEAVAVDTVNVYFTTDDPPSGPSSAGYVNKTTLATGTPVLPVSGAPAIAAASSLAYVATWVSGSPATGTIYDFSAVAGPKVAGTVSGSTLGIAVWGQTVFFTTQGSKAWTIPPNGTPASFSTSTEIAAGPIAADAMGVYWSTTSAHLLGAGLGGDTPVQLVPGALPAAVSAIATDASYVYWTDQSGGVYQVSKGGETSVSPPLVAPGGVRAYGLAVDPTDSTLYFARGTEVLRLSFPFTQPAIPIATGLVDPRGVAFDGNFVYVADRGTGNASSPDGRILKIAP